MASLNILPGALFLTTNFGINGRKFCKIDLTRLPCPPVLNQLTFLVKRDIFDTKGYASFGNMVFIDVIFRDNVFGLQSSKSRLAFLTEPVRQLVKHLTSKTGTQVS